MITPWSAFTLGQTRKFSKTSQIVFFFKTLIKILTNGSEKLQVYFDLVINSGISPDVSYHINLRFIFYSQP